MNCRGSKIYSCIAIKVLQFSVVFILYNILSSNKLNAQDTAFKKHELGIGYEPLFSVNYFEIHYKIFLKQKVYYNFHLGGLFNANSTNFRKYTEFMIVPSAELGFSLPFFRIFRFNATARVTGYTRQTKFDYTDSRSDGYNKHIGLFLGPDLGLEILPFRKNKIQFSIFGDAHSGFGLMNEKYFFPPEPVVPPYSSKEYRGNSTTGVFFGRIVIGISIRY